MRTFAGEKNYAVWDDQITKVLIQERTTSTTFSINPDEVIPRYLKMAEEQKSRTEGKGEVFTPYAVVKKMNDGVDERFKGSKADYIRRTVLEVTCGEGPYLTTRYDASTGETIAVKNRTGLVDRKLHCIPVSIGKKGYEECITEALKASYGYEWQSDSLYLARRNVLMTVIEFYVERFGVEPEYDLVLKWATIISYNLVKMDGISMCLPETSIPTKVMNWKTGKIERFDGKG